MTVYYSIRDRREYTRLQKRAGYRASHNGPRGVVWIPVKRIKTRRVIDYSSEETIKEARK